MPENVFQVFMSQHAPVGDLVSHADDVLWHHSALNPVVKERMRIAAAEAIGCSYCARFRTEDRDGSLIGQGREFERDQAELAEDFIRAVVATQGGISDELTVKMQQHFSAAEFTDLIFSLGWFIGMQHVGHIMHWDNSCPVAPIRALVESGEVA
jgi:alkylhydroperoxidase family enzyme